MAEALILPKKVELGVRRCLVKGKRLHIIEVEKGWQDSSVRLPSWRERQAGFRRSSFAGYPLAFSEEKGGKSEKGSAPVVEENGNRGTAMTSNAVAFGCPLSEKRSAGTKHHSFCRVKDDRKLLQVRRQGDREDVEYSIHPS